MSSLPPAVAGPRWSPVISLTNSRRSFNLLCMVKHSPIIISNEIRWLVKLRWIACLGVLAVVWLTSSLLKIVSNPLPLYLVTTAMLVYNLFFEFYERHRSRVGGNLDRDIFLQMIMDQVALILLLYFSSVPFNPFIFYFIFHVIIATLLLPGWIPYFLASLASFLVGAVMLLEHLGRIPIYNLELSGASYPLSDTSAALEGTYLLGFLIAFSTTLWITVYLTSAVHQYMRRAQVVIRQKEKMLGIGQLVAGIAHQISNPLDGIQNCLNTIGKKVQDDKHLTRYVDLMSEALERIEWTVKRVQSFARPHGLTLQDTDVNKVVETTAGLLGINTRWGIETIIEPGKVPLAMGDQYTLQEVIFNLCTNSLAAMPKGGQLRLRTFNLEAGESNEYKNVAIEVSDTGVGIPKNLMEKIFEPFFTTKAETGGTGLGLGLCRMLISEMGGRIEVESVLGEGTTFRIILVTTDIESRRTEDEDIGS